MNGIEKAEQTGCGGKCMQSPTDPNHHQSGGLQGWGLVLPAGGVFLVPLVLAVIGAVIAGSSRIAQIIGALSGLLIGTAGAAIIARLLRHTDEEESI